METEKEIIILKARVARLERQITDLLRRLEKQDQHTHPKPFDPNRPIGPPPGRAPWENINRNERGDEVAWPPLIRRLSK